MESFVRPYTERKDDDVSRIDLTRSGLNLKRASF
jgi:hypothetical protein